MRRRLLLTDGSGAIVPDGAHNFRFSLFNAPTGGVALWGPENQIGIAVTRGGFSVLLGSVTPLNLPFDEQYYLEIAVDGGAALLPRVALASSPYSLRAKIAEETFAYTTMGGTSTIGTGWTNYVGGSVVINAPGPGYVVVNAGFWLHINHVNGIKDVVQVGISLEPTGFAIAPGSWVGQVSAASPTESGYDLSGHVQYVFPIGPFPRTYYLVGRMQSGQDANDVFWFGSMSAIYHYDPLPFTPAMVEEAKKQP